MLLLARDEETGEAMTDRQVRDEALTLLFAGHETTAAALAWAWYLLARNPDAADRLRAEADGVLGDRSPAFDDLARLAYARSVFEESLPPLSRGLGPAASGHGRRRDRWLFHRRGTLVGPSQWVTHRRPDLWDDPERFDPERFAPGRSGGRHRFAYYPFGGGGRACLGAAWATSEAQIAPACLGRRFTFSRSCPAPRSCPIRRSSSAPSTP